VTGILERLGCFLRVPDMRPRAEIEADIREELAAHVALRARDNEAAGMPPEEALRDAELRFGDAERVVAACRDVQMKERIVLQRINVVLIVVLIVGAAANLWVGARAQERMSSEVASMRNDVVALAGVVRAERDRDAAPPPATTEVPHQAVYVLGKVATPGEISWREDLSLTKLIAIAGDFGEFANRSRVTVTRTSDEGRRHMLIDFDAIIAGKHPDVALEPDDVVYVPEAFF
jgi:hypothetical protein